MDRSTRSIGLRRRISCTRVEVAVAAVEAEASAEVVASAVAVEAVVAVEVVLVACQVCLLVSHQTSKT